MLLVPCVHAPLLFLRPFCYQDLYPDIENPPGPVRMSNAPTHSASQFRVSDDGLTVWNEKVLIGFQNTD